MAQNEGVYVFPEGSTKSGSSMSDLVALAALGGNGGFGGMNNPFWMMFMLPFIYPFFGSMMGGNGWFGGFGGNNNGTGFIANQLNNDAGRDLILQAINGRADALGQLAQITNSDINAVQNAINIVGSKIQEVGSQVGMSGLQVINAVQSGNASIAAQLAQCCCQNQLAVANQTAALQSTAAAHDASVRLQLAQNEAADQLAVCQQTNALSSQADRNANAILNAINAQTVAMDNQFCALKEREMQSKIDTQSDIITQLRGQISNDAQTMAFNKAITALDDKIDAIAAKQPQTVPVAWPSLTAVNTTPYMGQGYYPTYGGWGANGGIVL